MRGYSVLTELVGLNLRSISLHEEILHMVLPVPTISHTQKEMDGTEPEPRVEWILRSTPYEVLRRYTNNKDLIHHGCQNFTVRCWASWHGACRNEARLEPATRYVGR